MCRTAALSSCRMLSDSLLNIPDIPLLTFTLRNRYNSEMRMGFVGDPWFSSQSQEEL